MSETAPTSYQLLILRALQNRPVYGGTADWDTVTTRRLRNRVARKSRRINRLRGGK